MFSVWNVEKMGISKWFPNILSFLSLSFLNLPYSSRVKRYLLSHKKWDYLQGLRFMSESPQKPFPSFFSTRIWSYCKTADTLVKLVIASSFLFDKVFYDLLLYLSPCFLVQPNLILQSAGGIFSFLSTPHLALSDALGITKMNGRRGGLKAP